MYEKIKLENGLAVHILDAKQRDDGLFELKVEFSFTGYEDTLVLDCNGHNAEGMQGYNIPYETMEEIQWKKD